MALKTYHNKRDFRKTPEPKGADSSSGRKRTNDGTTPRYVIQKHDASRLHYDLRLRIGDVLASWAVPKGPSLDPSDKRLAVRTEDHPLEYAQFEGVIPEDEYGGGAVLLWDRGDYTPDDDDPARALDDGKLSFTLDGEKLRGSWTLTRMGGSSNGDKQRWLLIKQKDKHASSRGKPIVERKPRSVKSGRTIDEIAAEAERNGTGSGHAKRSSATDKRSKKSTPSKRSRSTARNAASSAAADLDGARKASLPTSFSPQLCTLVDEPPTGDDWIHEIKFDGYRLVLRKDGDRVTLLTRNGKDWSAKFPPITDAAKRLPCDAALIDGEAIILEDSGRSSFQRLQQAIKDQRFEHLAFHAFDIMHLDGVDLTRVALTARKRVLHDVLTGGSGGADDTDGPGPLRYTDHIEGEGDAVHANACRLGLEGVIAKRANAAYTQRRSKSWLKVKCARRQEFVIVGSTPPSGSRKHFGSLLLATHDDDHRLIYAGRVGAGFDNDALRDIAGKLRSRSRKTSPLADDPPRSVTRDARWVTPELVAEVQFTEWTEDGRLRHPSFQGLRTDKDAENVRRERPKATDAVIKGARSMAPKGQTMPRTSAAPSRNAKPTVAGVAISSPDRVVFPDANVTKLQLAEYYESIAEHILPFLKDRPLSTVRCPEGRQKQCFFQKHVGQTFSGAVRSITVEQRDGEAQYIAVDSVEGLVSLAQFGVIEIHPWGARRPASSGAPRANLDKPDTLTFDLDPGEGVEWADLARAARRVRDVLDDAGLTSYAKASGGKGLHVVVPLQPAADWDAAKAFCRNVAELLTKQHPDEYVAKASKSARRGKIFIDWLRNTRGATSIAPYSARARPNAPVAACLRWPDLTRLARADKYTITTIHRRLSQLDDDPWEGYWTTRQRLTAGKRGRVG